MSSDVTVDERYQDTFGKPHAFHREGEVAFFTIAKDLAPSAEEAQNRFRAFGLDSGEGIPKPIFRGAVSYEPATASEENTGWVLDRYPHAIGQWFSVWVLDVAEIWTGADKCWDDMLK